MLIHNYATLCVIDFQDSLLAKIPAADDIMKQTVKLIRFARELALPIVWTEQYPKGLGATHERIRQELEGCLPIEKISFGCFGEPAFCDALAQTERNQLLITGVEAHVCVMQTALVALTQGWEVYIVSDAVASRHEREAAAGLARMQAKGAELVTTEMAMFEMLRVAGTPEFKRVLPLIK